MQTAARIRRRARSDHRAEIVALGATCTSGATSLTLATLTNAVVVGAELEIGSELVRVTAVNTSTNAITVIRGWADSTAAAHTAGDVVRINPRFSLQDIYEMMVTELASWDNLYRLLDDTFTVDTGAVNYELPVAWANMRHLITVRQKAGSSSYLSWPRISTELIHGTPTGFDGASTSGKLLRFRTPLLTGDIYVRGALPFATFTLDDDLVADVGLSDGMLEVLELGTLLKMLGDDLQARTARNAQDEARRAEETPLGALVPSNQWLFATYMRRRSEEAAKLLARDGVWM